MKKKFLFILAILLVSLTTIAQEKRDTIRSIDRKQMISARQKQKKLADSLNLTRAQEKRIRQLNKEFRNKFKEARENNGMSNTEKREKLKALLEARNVKLKDILDAEQLAKYQRIMRDRLTDSNLDEQN